MSEDQLKLLHGYLDGALTEAEMATLEDLLRNNPEARRTLRSLATIDASRPSRWFLQSITTTFSNIVQPPPGRGGDARGEGTAASGSAASAVRRGGAARGEGVLHALWGKTTLLVRYSF